MRKPRWLVGLLLVLAVLPLAAQRRGFGGGRGFVPAPAAMPYDGKFAIARLWYPFYGGWAFDYPEMEQNLNLILPEITAITPSPSGGNVLRMDDPELMKFPIAYLSEPGYWYPSDTEVEGLRTYIAKGGFLIVDDFHFAQEWNVFEVAMTRVMPRAKIVRLDISHPIFNTFFALSAGESFTLINDHDPKPLHYHFKAELPGKFEWEYLEAGPQVWRVRIGKPSAGK